MTRHITTFIALTLSCLAPVFAQGTDPWESAATYTQGESRAALNAIEQEVVDAAKQPATASAMAERLAELAARCQTPESKLFVCRQLAIVGTPETAKALAPWLHDPALSDEARYALQPIDGEAVDAILIEAANATSGAVRAGLAATLGARRAEDAVAVLTDFAMGDDPAVASAAAYALGEIGGKAAALGLVGAHLAQSDETLQREIANARLACAEAFREAGNDRAALFVYRSIYFENKNPSAARAAALHGLYEIAPDEAGPWITWGLTDHTADVQKAAALLRTMRELRATAN